MAKPAKQLKIILVGADGVGKTSLINQFLTNGEDREASNNSKLGAIMNSTRKISVDNEEYLLEVVDSEELRFGNKQLNQDLRQADGFLFVFSHSDRESVEFLKRCKGSITKERTKPLSCILVGTVDGDQSPNNSPASSNLNINTAKKHNSLRAKSPPNMNNNTLPTRSHSNNAVPPPSSKELLGPTSNLQVVNDSSATVRDLQDLCALFDTSLTRVVFRNQQPDKSVVSDLFVQVVREISSGSSKKKSKFRYSRCDTEDLQFVTDTTQREADSESVPPSIKAASFTRLVERATYEKHPNPELVDDLLITYRAFSNATTFLNLLIGRYDLPKPNGVDKVTWTEHLQKAIRLRVISLLKSWVEGYPDDFKDPVFAERLLVFVTNTLQKDHKALADKIEKTIRSRDIKIASKMSFGRSPPSRIKKKLCDNLLDLSALECARQLALIDHSMYKEILPLHCLHGTWSKDDPTNAVAAVIMRFNTVSSFLVSCILAESKAKHRAKIIEKIVSIADKCRMLNNFNALIMTMSSLENIAVYRLKDTWKLISSQRKDQFIYLRTITAAKGNYSALRKAVASASQPLVPYLGVYLSMLLFIEDGNKDTSEDNLINWEKFKMLAQVIKDIRQYQQSMYMFEIVPSIREFLFPPKNKLLAEEEAYTRSYMLEPGRAAMLSMKIKNPKPSTSSTGTTTTIPRQAPSPPSSLKWEKGKVTRMLNEAEESLMGMTGSDDASKSIAQLYSSQSNDFVALLNEWVLKMRQVSTVINDTTRIMSDIIKVVLSSQAIAPTSPEKDGNGGEETTMRCIDYVATLTRSKVVEGIVEKFLTGTTATIPLTLYEWFGYTLVATPQFVKALVTSLHNIAKLKPLPELVVAISEMVGRLKAPPLNSKEVWNRRRLASRTVELVQSVHSNFSPAATSPVQLNTLKMDTSGKVLKVLEEVLRSAMEVPAQVGVDTNFGFLHEMLERLRGKDFPRRTEILQATAVLLMTINQEYPSSSASPTTPPLSPMASFSPAPIFPQTASPMYSNPPALIPSPSTPTIHSPVPIRPSIPSALLGGPRSNSPNISSNSLRSSANAIMLSQTPPLPSISPSASPDIRRNPPRSPSVHSPLPPLQRTISNLQLQPSSPTLPNRSTLNLSTLPAPPSPPHLTEMIRTSSLQQLQNQNQTQTQTAVSSTPSPQAPSQSPRVQASKASPASKQTPLPSPTASSSPKIPLSPPSSLNSLGGSPLTRTGSFSPPSTSAPCGLLGDWEASLEMFFKGYLHITQQHAASTRDQLIVFRKRLNKLNELRCIANSGTNTLGISDAAIEEQFAEHSQQARNIMDQVDTLAIESNQFVDYVLDCGSLGNEAMARVDLSLVKRIFTTLNELHSIQEELEQEMQFH